MDEDTYNILWRQDWDKIGRQLVAWAVGMARASGLVYGDGWELRQGRSVEDIAQDVVLDTLSGARHYDPSKGALLPWLFDQVRSEMSNLWRSAGNRREVPIADDEDSDERVGAARLGMAKPPGTTAEDIAGGVIDAVDARRRVDQILELVRGDPEIEELLLAMLDCGPTPRFLAEHLGVTPDEVHNRKKRLQRLLEKAGKSEQPRARPDGRRTA
ncbi:MAG: sigma factor [Anaerolineae bacterium]